MMDQQKPKDRPGYLRTAEAAQHLSISERTLADWQRKRMVPFYKMSHRVCLFKMSDLEKALERYRIGAVGEEGKRP